MYALILMEVPGGGVRLFFNERGTPAVQKKFASLAFLQSLIELFTELDQTSYQKLGPSTGS